MLSRAPLFAMIAPMKRFVTLPVLFLAAIFLGCLLFAPAHSASAASYGYAVADAPDVWLYEDADGTTPLFILPYTYYVRVLSSEGEFSRVEYAADREPYRAIQGYCRTETLTPVNFLPENPYLRYILEINYTISDMGGVGSADLVSFTREVAYYGHFYENGQLYFYVRYRADGIYQFGRLPYGHELDYERNTDYLDAVFSPEGGGGEPALSAVAIALICVGSVAAVAIAVFVLRGRKPAVQEPESAEF